MSLSLDQPIRDPAHFPISFAYDRTDSFTQTILLGLTTSSPLDFFVYHAVRWLRVGLSLLTSLFTLAPDGNETSALFLCRAKQQTPACTRTHPSYNPTDPLCSPTAPTPHTQSPRPRSVPMQTSPDGNPLPDGKATFFTYDRIFDEDSSTEAVYDGTAKEIVHSVSRGMNGTIFAYGQTSSGKTFTMQVRSTAAHLLEQSSYSGGLVVASLPPWCTAVVVVLRSRSHE